MPGNPPIARFEDLQDVQFGTPVTGWAPLWNSATSKMVMQVLPGSTTPTFGQVLVAGVYAGGQTPTGLGGLTWITGFSLSDDSNGGVSGPNGFGISSIGGLTVPLGTPINAVGGNQIANYLSDGTSYFGNSSASDLHLQNTFGLVIFSASDGSVTFPAGITAGTGSTFVVASNGDVDFGAVSLTLNGQAITNWPAGAGTVTSVSMTVPNALLSVSPSSITSSGTFSVSLISAAASRFLATPATGPSATPTLRAIVASDVPPLNQSTTGSAATLTTPRAINGVNFDGSAPITVAAAASTLTGTTLASGVTASSLTSFGASVALGMPASGNLANCTLSSTTVTPGSYTSANLTIGADGRITAAANGSSGSSNYFGTGADGAVTVATNTTWATSTGVDDTGIVVKNFTSLTINSGVTVKAANRAQVMIIYVTGNCDIEGHLSMDALGAAATPTSATFLARVTTACSLLTEEISAGNQVFTISQVGGLGGTAVTTGNGTPGNSGSAGSNGQTGGGGSGAGGSGGSGAVGTGGSGGAGTSFCGGSGGGAGGYNTSAGTNGTSGGTNGGTGGSGGTNSATRASGAGAGNPVGTGNAGTGTSISSPSGGGGGCIILVVGGSLTIGGTISTNGGNGGGAIGASGGDALGGGGAGGGSVILLYVGALSNTGVIQSLGGSAGTASGGSVNAIGGAGGNGSVQIFQVEA